MTGRKDPPEKDRLHEAHRGYALAGKSALNRLELTPEGGRTRYKKIEYGVQAIEGFFLALFIHCHEKPPEEIIVDLDATNDPLHGKLLRKFRNGCSSAEALLRRLDSAGLCRFRLWKDQCPRPMTVPGMCDLKGPAGFIPSSFVAAPLSSAPG
ncbi:MAG: transposase [Planctomycetes bacterium]|nr:transposase [Planctomycetota bacterium]